jgi:2-C-methyl-D-erythritol 4-phosphate cytidylyltransferase/2-C-methyl-D-erythritol 2,4-cyclodiphosphate synthase
MEEFADAVVVAAGTSSRMGGIDKLEAPLQGRPLLAWSVAAMAGAESVRRVIVVAPPDRLDAVRAASWLARYDAAVVAGGERRSDSVLAGVRATDAPIVLVHDGARPLASSALADAVAAAAAETGAAAPVLPVFDSVKRDEGGRLRSVEREALVRAQTPQGARRELLLAAFDAAGGRAYTDEAALLEAHGVAVASVPGEVANFKVTEPRDLEMARGLASARTEMAVTRVGFGQDSHPFGPGDGLWLGGVEFAAAPRLYGHSDGDVALHALANAILAACRLGDLGRMFPPTDPRTRGAPSAGFLGDVVRAAQDAGWEPRGAQVSLVGARPRLGAERLEAIRGRVAELLGVPVQEVAVTASTGNLAGPEGAGRGFSASALVTLGAK